MNSVRSVLVICVMAFAVACGGDDTANNNGKSTNGSPNNTVNNTPNNTANNTPNNTNNTPTNNTPNNEETCGNGTLDDGEACDSGIAAGEAGACPTDCGGEACEPMELMGSADDCSAECVGTTIVECTNGDGCCPSNCDFSNDDDCDPVCGNGVLEGDELCDGDCPTNCDDGVACTEDTMTGSPDTCDAVCSNEPITACVDGDNCCPDGCDATEDAECGAVCGDGVVEPGETCDGDCPTSCDDGNSCTTDMMTGDPSTCDVECVNNTITMCTDDDGCCPPQCNVTNDNDCSASCGNGVVEAGETCDGDCPTSCDDGNACTTDSMTGSAGNCNVTCTNNSITMCVDGDGCCPSNCDATNDDDCSGTCGNGVVEAGETCDGNCPADCDDGDACTIDGSTGSEANCSLECTNSTITSCQDGDGCCPSGCDATNDDDCVQDQPVGAACESGGECESGACFDEPITDGYCTELCIDDTDCPSGSHCGFIGDEGFGVCLDDCADNSECRTDYECYDADESGVDECWTVGSGSGDPGDACQEHGDCAGGQGGWCVHDSQGWQDGYCAQECTTQDPCPSGSHCALFDTNTGVGVCLADCQDDTNCRADGYLCYDLDEDAEDECAAAATGSGAVGDPCSELYECGGGTDGGCFTQSSGWRNGYCTEVCNANNPCPSGSHCGALDADGEGVCLLDCAGNSNCRLDGYLCEDVDLDAADECWPAATGTGQVGDPCSGQWECVGGLWGACIGESTWPGGYCTILCGTDEGSCTASSVCEPTNEICVESCSVDGDCRTDYTCQATTAGDACLP